jgi:hypothetical protein
MVGDALMIFAVDRRPERVLIERRKTEGRRRGGEFEI